MHNLYVFCTFSTFTQEIFKGWDCNFTWSFRKVMRIKSLKIMFGARIISYKLCMIYAFFWFFLFKNYFFTAEINVSTRGPMYTCLVSFQSTCLLNILAFFYFDQFWIINTIFILSHSIKSRNVGALPFCLINSYYHRLRLAICWIDRLKNAFHAIYPYRSLTMASNTKRHQCLQCDKSYAHKLNLDEHILTHTGERPHSCNVCLKTFTKRSCLYNHTKTHSGEVFTCDLCGKEYGNKYSLVLHKRRHTGERPYVCEQCGKAFIRKTGLDQHIRSHIGIKAFKCQTCERSFMSKLNLDVHMRTHSGEKPYSCQICGRAFAHTQSLNSHMTVHSNDKKHSCDICHKAFSRKSGLSQHSRVHTGLRPFQCSLCEKCFPAKVNLERHYLVHSGEKPHQCDLCLKQFSQKGSCDRHKILVHSIVDDDVADQAKSTLNSAQCNSNDILNYKRTELSPFPDNHSPAPCFTIKVEDVNWTLIYLYNALHTYLITSYIFLTFVDNFSEQDVIFLFFILFIVTFF